MNRPTSITNTTAGQADPFGGNRAARSNAPARQAAPAPDASPLQKIHRLLRGRYGLATTLAITGALLGTLAGWLSQTPGYRSTGLIEVVPFIPSTSDSEKVMPLWQQYVQGQVNLLQSQKVIEKAVNTEQWRELRPGMSREDMIADFRDNLTVEYIRGTMLIQVAFTDNQSKVAQQAVDKLIRSYEDLYGNSYAAGLDKKIELLSGDRVRDQGELNASMARIESLAQTYGMEQLDTLLGEKTKEVVDLSKRLANAEMTLAQSEASVADGGGTEPTTITPETVNAIASADPRMAALVGERDVAQRNLERMLLTMGPNHRWVLNAQAEVGGASRRIETRAIEYLKQFPGIPTGSGTFRITQKELGGLRDNVAMLRETRDREQLALSDMARVKQDIAGERSRADLLKARLADTERRLDELSAQQTLAGRLKVISYGEEPVSYATDRRKQLAAVGLIGGAMLPLGLLLLMGLLDSRFRYSDEAHTELAGANLLGILPNLPDRLTDPEQASVAAHCVHQIRTLMQISGGGPGRQTFAITSAAPGDGKTSLTLALGLSYSACGTRVLLIDCDLVGAGLTARMNVQADEGILEAVANRGLLEYIRNTDVADVAVLPVGTNQTHHASTMSPQGLRRLIDEARKHFEVILIDTGPVLGSMEASLACSAADGVILAVARGQQRPLVTKTLEHLKGINAHLVGVVFNKAQASDFGASISGMSVALRSRRQTSPAQFGPVARAVATAGRSNSSDNA